MIPRPKIPTGTMSSASTMLHIIKIEILDADGSPLIPPEVEFWIATMSTPPQLIEGPFHNFTEANVVLKNMIGNDSSYDFT